MWVLFLAPVTVLQCSFVCRPHVQRGRGYRHLGRRVQRDQEVKGAKAQLPERLRRAQEPQGGGAVLSTPRGPVSTAPYTRWGHKIK